MKPTSFRTLDVRPLLERGIEPFLQIRTEISALRPDEGLILLSPFRPSPLIQMLQAEGFASTTEWQADGSWRTVFERVAP